MVNRGGFCYGVSGFSKPREFRMPHGQTRPGRPVSVGSRIYFDDDTAVRRIVFADEPTMPALISKGSVLVMSTPITLVGGKQEFSGPPVVAEFAENELKFANGKTIPLSAIRGGNWGYVKELPSFGS